MIDLIKRYPVVIVSVGVILAALGGTLKVALPVEQEVADLKIEVAQRWDEQAQAWERQKGVDRRQEIEHLRWQMRMVAEEINRLNTLPQYLNRPLTDQEQWLLQSKQNEWKLLKQREMELSK